MSERKQTPSQQAQAQPMQQQPGAGDQGSNQGEGNRDAARAYNDGATRTARSGTVGEKAQEAAKGSDGPEGAELRRAEREGASHAKDEDPQVKR